MASFPDWTIMLFTQSGTTSLTINTPINLMNKWPESISAIRKIYYNAIHLPRRRWFYRKKTWYVLIIGDGLYVKYAIILYTGWQKWLYKKYDMISKNDGHEIYKTNAAKVEDWPDLNSQITTSIWPLWIELWAIFLVCQKKSAKCVVPDTKVHGANMGPTWVLLAPVGSHVGPRRVNTVL